MNKLTLGKTATSRTRKKLTSKESNTSQLPADPFTHYLLAKNYSLSSIESFKVELRKFETWLQKENLGIEEVGYNDITSYLQSFTNISAHTRGCYLRGVKHYFNFLIYQGDRTDNPVEFIHLRGMKRKTLYDILNRHQLDSLYSGYSLAGEGKNKTRLLAHQRNKVILGLMVFQALDARDLKLLSVSDVKLREGKISIPGTRRSNERELKLEALQIMDMVEYLHTTRAALLELSGKTTDRLFISTGTGERFSSVMVYLLGGLRRVSPKVSSVQQIKTSVIVHWLKLYNLRKVQYMAGHRYVSSTEGYQMNNLDELMEDISRFHPLQ